MVVLRAESTQVTYGEQTAFLSATTAAGASRWPGIVQTVDGIFPEIDWKEIRARGFGRDVFIYTQGKRVLEGTIKVQPQWLSNRILKYAFDSLVTTGGGDPFTHTLSGSAGTPAIDLAPITLRRGYAINATQEVAFYVRDCIADAMEFSGAEEDILEVALSIKAGKPAPPRATETIMSVSKDTSQTFPYHKGTFTINGSSTARIKSFRFRVENQGHMNYYYQNVDGDYPFEYVPGARKYTFECDVVPIDDTFLAYVDAASPSTTASFDVLFTGQASPARSIELKGNVGGATGVIKSAPYNVPETDEITVPIVANVNQAQVIVLDSLNSASWTTTP